MSIGGAICVGVLAWAAVAASVAAFAGPDAGPAVRVRSFLPQKPISRAMRPSPVVAVVENTGDVDVTVKAQLVVPSGVRRLAGTATQAVTVPAADHVKVVWQVQAARPGDYRLAVRLAAGAASPVETPLTMGFLEPVKITRPAYIPEPRPIKAPILVGVHNCPLWEADQPEMWANVLKHPERTPALGFYDGALPEVADWETKWAVEHGINFFIYCWYRTSQGKPVETMYSAAIEKALQKSRFRSHMKYTIMWENQRKGVAGVADEKDLMENLLPYWMEHYFKDPSYLKVDNKPVLFIYVPGNMWGGSGSVLGDLGSVENVRKAFDKMREACRREGFDGLTILGEYRGTDAAYLKSMKAMGFDYTFAYCWYVPNNPTPQQSIDAQMAYIRKTQELGAIPQVVTVSQAWSGWADEGTIWKIPPKDYEQLLTRARDFIGTLPKDQLGSQMLILDNWNEWGEGHYIAPYREYGFGYEDAIRKVIAGNTKPHQDLIPEDVGRGPYDTAYTAWAAHNEAAARLTNKKVTKPGAPEGLIGWWTFDEDATNPVAFDNSGHRLGGLLEGIKRAAGLEGSALVCDGGCVLVQSNPALSPTAGVSIECWVKTDVAGQGNTWMVNRVLSGGTDAGYRLGVVDGKPCFEVPQTSFSHHLSADIDLPTGRWVHVAGTFDGQTMRIYVDGQEHGTMDRPGPVKASSLHLVLGNYELKHAAYFHGLLDEVRLYGRALTPEEVKAHYGQFAGKG